MKRSILVAGIVGAVTGGFVACSPANRKVCDGDTLGVEPELCVDRSALGFATEFGSGTFIGTRPVDSVIISNRGQKPLEISKLTFQGEPEFKVTASWAGTAVGSDIPATSIPGAGKAYLQVEFGPRSNRGYSASIDLDNNSTNQGRLTIQLTGCGVLTDGGESNCYSCDVLEQACTPQIDGGARTCYLTNSGGTFCAFNTGTKALGEACDAPTDCAKGFSCLPPSQGADSRCMQACARTGGTCAGGKACVAQCGRGETLCSGECVETSGTDPRHCGACGVTCGANQSCLRFVDGGVGCINECAAGQGQCDGGGCIEFTTAIAGRRALPSTAQHCGGCNIACAASESCRDGTCVRAPCDSPSAICRAALRDGGAYDCVNLQTDRANCGRCGNDCVGNCVAGKCQPPANYNVCAL